MKRLLLASLLILAGSAHAATVTVYWNSTADKDGKLIGGLGTTWNALDLATESQLNIGTGVLFGTALSHHVIPFSITNGDIPSGRTITSAELRAQIVTTDAVTGVLGVREITPTGLNKPTWDEYDSVTAGTFNWNVTGSSPKNNDHIGGTDTGSLLDSHSMSGGAETATWDVTSALPGTMPGSTENVNLLLRSADLFQITGESPPLRRQGCRCGGVVRYKSRPGDMRPNVFGYLSWNP